MERFLLKRLWGGTWNIEIIMDKNLSYLFNFTSIEILQLVKLIEKNKRKILLDIKNKL